jgi:hypothetical protein
MPDQPPEPGRDRPPSADPGMLAPVVDGPDGPPARDGGAEAAPSAAPLERERVIRGIPIWLVRGYLEDLGARPSSPATQERVALAADAWGALLEQVEDFQIGSLRVGQVRLSLTGDDTILRPMLAALEKRLFRGGG